MDTVTKRLNVLLGGLVEGEDDEGRATAADRVVDGPVVAGGGDDNVRASHEETLGDVDTSEKCALTLEACTRGGNLAKDVEVDSSQVAALPRVTDMPLEMEKGYETRRQGSDKGDTSDLSAKKLGQRAAAERSRGRDSDFRVLSKGADNVFTEGLDTVVLVIVDLGEGVADGPELGNIVLILLNVAVSATAPPPAISSTYASRSPAVSRTIADRP